MLFINMKSMTLNIKGYEDLLVKTSQSTQDFKGENRAFK